MTEWIEFAFCSTGLRPLCESRIKHFTPGTERLLRSIAMPCEGRSGLEVPSARPARRVGPRTDAAKPRKDIAQATATYRRCCSSSVPAFLLLDQVLPLSRTGMFRNVQECPGMSRNEHHHLIEPRTGYLRLRISHVQRLPALIRKVMSTEERHRLRWATDR